MGLAAQGYARGVGEGGRDALNRALDTLIAGTALILTSPVLATAIVAIRIESSGTPIYRQRRVGKDGRRFSVVKFRTMVRDAEALTGELLALSQDPHWLLLEHDPRVTRVGRLLRLTSIDELSQLWNVVKGEMSVVGARPLIASDFSHVVGWGRDRLGLAPGLTGPWQVLGRTRIPFEEMLKLDYWYVTNWSLWTDVQLVLRTVPVLLTRRGAN